MIRTNYKACSECNSALLRAMDCIETAEVMAGNIAFLETGHIQDKLERIRELMGETMKDLWSLDDQ